jgi:hypothetical protein
MYLKVTDEPNLVRDTKSKAILNVNNDALNKYKQERERLVQMQKVILEHEEIKKDISEIKQLLLQLMDRK